MKDIDNKIVEIADVKNVIKEYLKVWGKEELERNIKIWFDDELN